jgi:hypothetical protein
LEDPCILSTCLGERTCFVTTTEAPDSSSSLSISSGSSIHMAEASIAGPTALG